MWGEDCTVGPQTYMPTRPGTRGSSSRNDCDNESNRRMLTCQSYRALLCGDVSVGDGRDALPLAREAQPVGRCRAHGDGRSDDIGEDSF